MNGLAFYSAYDKNGNHIAKRHGIGNYEKVSNTKIIFSDFIITDGNDVSRFIIDSAVYDVHLSIPILVISYRKNVNPETGFPWYTEIPAPIWSDEVMTDDFLLQDE